MIVHPLIGSGYDSTIFVIPGKNGEKTTVVDTWYWDE